MPKAYDQLRILHLADSAHAGKILRNALDVFDIKSIRQCLSPDETYEMVQCFPFDLAILDWVHKPQEAIQIVQTRFCRSLWRWIRQTPMSSRKPGIPA